MTNRRFPPPWTVQRLPGGFKVIDASGQSLAYFYARDNDNDAGTAGVLTMDEGRLASNSPSCQCYSVKGIDASGFNGERARPMPTDIADVAESLRLDFGETARWRREKAAEHAEDSRNVEAAELLDRLAKTIKDVDPTLLDAYGSLWDDDVQDLEQHSEMLRLIGFQSFPQTAEEFVREYITKRTGG